ncbi:MAG TPA: hypothetical protein PLS81_08315 [Deltaproteobacteria bacterium]|nr:hypothetical protein [Deltaproteobacteria bacterium]HPP80101.1 hypothetical protein [Deltaproteobacteria bacterium]
MFKKIKKGLRRLFSRWMGNPFLGVKLPHITDSDLSFEHGLRRMFREKPFKDAPDHGFISYLNLEDYTRDFIVFYKTNRNSFRLDHSQKDGHFRV